MIAKFVKGVVNGYYVNNDKNKDIFLFYFIFVTILIIRSIFLFYFYQTKKYAFTFHRSHPGWHRSLLAT